MNIVACFKTGDNHMECRTRMEYEIYGTRNGINNVLLKKNEIVIPWNIGKRGTLVMNPVIEELDGYPTKIFVHGIHQDDRTGRDGGCSNNKGESQKTVMLYDSNYPCVSTNRLTNFFGDYGGSASYFEYTITPINLSEPKATRNGNDIIDLLESRKTKIEAPTGYNPATYKWTYRIGDSGSPNDFPPQFQGQSSFEVCASDFIANLGEVAGKKKVYIILDAGCAGTFIKPLNVKLDAPSIVRAEPMPTLCKSDLGKISVEISRNLYDGEFLNFRIYSGNNPQEGDQALTTIPESQIESKGNNKYEVTGVPISRLFSAGILSYHGNEDNPLFSNLSDLFCSKGITVSPPPPFTAELLNETDPVCFEGNDGSVTVRANGGSGLYRVECKLDGDSLVFDSGTPVAGDIVVPNLQAGSYQLYVYDSNGCLIDNDFLTCNLYEPTDPVRITGFPDYREASIDETNQEEANGMIAAEIEGGKAPYKVTWRSGSIDGPVVLEETISASGSGGFTATLNGAVSGTYYLEVEDGFGCHPKSSFTLNRAPEIHLRLQQTGVIQCAEDETGSLSVEIDGGYTPYKLTWYKNSVQYAQNTGVIGTGMLSGLGIGQYRVLVTDDHNSRAWSASITLSELTHIDVNFTSSQLRCRHHTDGYLEVSASGGSSPYTYQWLSGGGSGSRIDGLGMGSYTVRAIDSNGCSTLATSSISGPEPMSVRPLITQPSCAAMSNGSIQLSISGGNPAYAISWNNGSNQDRIQGLGTGNYSVHVTDQYGCEDFNLNYAIQAPTPVLASVEEVKNVTAFGLSNGTIKVKVSGGTPSYSVVANNGTSSIYPQRNTIQPDSSIVYEFLNLPCGKYSLDIKDRNYRNAGDQYIPCKDSLGGIIITQPPKLELTTEILGQITCFNGNNGILAAHAKGGVPLTGALPYTYEWYRVEGANKTLLSCTDSIFSEASKGRYQVRILDKNSTVVFAELEMDHPRLIKIRLEPTNVVCGNPNSGSITSFVSGGIGSFNYLWSSGDTIPSITEKPIGRYTLTVTDERGCSASLDTVIISPSHVTFNPTIYPESCAGHHDASIYLSPVGGDMPYTYSWSNGGNYMFADSLAPGTYSVRIIDANLCMSDTTFVIPYLPPIKVNQLTLIQPRAFGYSDGSLSVEITGGYQPYKAVWSNESGTILFDDSLVIENGKAKIELQNLSMGTYSLRIQDSNYPEGSNLGFNPCGCLHEYSIFLPEPPKLEVTISESHFISCYSSNDGSIASDAKGGVPFENGIPYRFSWYLNGQPINASGSEATGLGYGTYQLKITDANEIEAWSDQLVLQQPDLLQIKTSAADLRCSRDTDGWASVTATGGTAPYTYEWSTGDLTPGVVGLSRGKYMVWVVDSRGCEQIGNVKIVKPDSMVIAASLIPPTCFEGSDGEIRTQISGGTAPYHYAWSNETKSGTLSGVKKGTYMLTVSDADECNHQILTYELSEPGYVFIDLGENRTLCDGQKHEIKAISPEPAHSFNWLSPQGQSIHHGETYTLFDPGTYRVEATTAKGCKASGEVTIKRDNHEIAAEFMVANKVPLHDDVYFVNITEPAPDSIVWILPESGAGYTVVEADNSQMRVVFSEYGSYTFGMQSYSGECYETIYKTITAMNKLDIDDYEDADGPSLRTFAVSPNPAREHFVADIELGKNSSAVLLLVDSGTGRTIERRILAKGKKFKETFDLNGPNTGTYVLHLTTSEVRSAVKVIVKN